MRFLHFAGPATKSRHNLNYWTFGDYVGIGAGAHGKLTYSKWQHQCEPSELDRQWITLITARSNRFDAPATKAIAVSDLPGEFAMNALRLRSGGRHRLLCGAHRAA